MTNTAFQNQSLALAVGVPVNLNLAAFCSGATSFGIIGTSRAAGLSLLPPGLSMNSAGLITGTPTTAGVTLCRARAYNGTRNADASWNARKAGAYNSERFDTDVVTGFGNSRSTYDTSVKRSGIASLLQRKDVGDSHAAGTYASWFWSTRIAQQAVFNPNSGLFNLFADNTGFGPGEEFYIQFSVMPDDNYCRVSWPPDPKIAILDNLPWSVNSNLGPTANDWEIVTTQHDGSIYGYYNSPQGPGWSNFGDTGGGDLNFQPAVSTQTRVLNGNNPGLASGGGTSWTAAQQKRAKYGQLYSTSQGGYADGRPDPLQSPGPAWAINQWHTILLHIKNGSGTVSASENVPGSMLAWDTRGIVEVSMAHDGQDYIQLFSYATRPHVTRTSAPHYDRSGTLTNAQDTTWGGLQLTNLVYNNLLTGIPATKMWIDELICKSSFIPAPDVGDGTGSYKTTDVLLTFKVS